MREVYHGYRNIGAGGTLSTLREYHGVSSASTEATAHFSPSIARHHNLKKSQVWRGSSLIVHAPCAPNVHCFARGSGNNRIATRTGAMSLPRVYLQGLFAMITMQRRGR